MLMLQEKIKIFIKLSPTDMRKSIDGLCALVVDYFSETPQSQHLFLFYNQSKNKVKIPWFIFGFILAAALVTWIPALQAPGSQVLTAREAKLGL